MFQMVKIWFWYGRDPNLRDHSWKGTGQNGARKIKAVKEWKTPIKIKDIESFLGFANFY